MINLERLKSLFCIGLLGISVYNSFVDQYDKACFFLLFILIIDSGKKI